MLVTTERMVATKVTLADADGKTVLYVYGHSAEAIAAAIKQLPDVVQGAVTPKRRGRKPKEAEAAPAAA